MFVAPAALYWLVPAVLWYRFGFSTREEICAQRPGIRSRIEHLYIPVAVIDCYFLGGAVLDGLWGFLVFFVGVHLISLGYMQLARQSNPGNFEGKTTRPSG